MHFEIIDDVWIDLVGISVLAGVLLLCFAYVLWCHLGVKARQAPTDGTVKAGIFRLGAARGDLRTMACLLSSAAVDVDAAHGDFTALHTAAVMGQTGEARGSNSAECSETAAPDMECLYHLQACSPHNKVWCCPAADAATWLCVHGAAISAQKRDGWGETALHYAAAKGHPDIVDLLLTFGADPAATNFAGGWCHQL